MSASASQFGSFGDDAAPRTDAAGRLLLRGCTDPTALYPYSPRGMENFTEDFSFIFFSVGADDRFKFVNRAWYEFAERNAPPEVCIRLGVGTLFEPSIDPAATQNMEQVRREVRAGFRPYWEEIVPCHSPNQIRWMLYRIQNCGPDLLCTCYFLRAYAEQAPADPKIRCIITAGDRDRDWQSTDDPVGPDTSLALGPECSKQVYLQMAYGGRF